LQGPAGKLVPCDRLGAAFNEACSVLEVPFAVVK
jgi:hypothetical protein